MKTLYIIRHAKSAWNTNDNDLNRPLKQRGFNDAKLVSTFIKDKINKPNLILSSNANRAQTTAKLFVKELNYNENDITLEPKLYDFTGSNLLETIKQCDNTVNTLMLFGHNNAITAFVNTYGSIYVDNVPTSGFIWLEFDINHWKNLKQGKTILNVFPKHLK